MGWIPQRKLDGTWTYPSLEELMAEEVVQEVDTYTTRLHNTVMQFIAKKPILDLCLAAARRPGARVLKPWWEQ